MKRMLAEADPDRPFLLLLYIEDQVEIYFHGFLPKKLTRKYWQIAAGAMRVFRYIGDDTDN